MLKKSSSPTPPITPAKLAQPAPAPRSIQQRPSMAESGQSRKRFRAIQLRIVFYMAMRNITSKKLRSFLTVFGVVIGIGSIFFLLSFGIGIQDLVTKQVIGDKSLKALEVSSPNSRILQLDDAAINRIRRYPNVDKVGLQYSFQEALH